MNVLQEFFQNKISPILCNQCNQSIRISPDLVHGDKLLCHCGNTLMVMTEETHSAVEKARHTADEINQMYKASLEAKLTRMGAKFNLTYK